MKPVDTTLHIMPELYRLGDVCAVLGVGRSTIYTLMESDPTFPEQVRLSRRAVRWRRTEIEEWARSRPAIKRRSKRPRSGRAVPSS